MDWVSDGMVLGLGTGTTSAYFIDLLGERLQSGKLSHIQAVPTSEATAQRAGALGIPLTTLADQPRLHLAVDGADEVSPELDLIKGLGGALLREKVVEIHADTLLIIVDGSKLVARLGTRGPLPVEIIPFEVQAHLRWLNTLGCRAELWLQADGSPIVTDNSNYLARCWFEGGISDPYELARQLADRPGIVEHGLFLGMASQVIAATPQGIQTFSRQIV
jgi:ribose 5-phosphate isomerase A